MLYDFVTVDPGIHTGWCAFSGKSPHKWGSFTHTPGLTALPARVNDLAIHFENILPTSKRIYLEGVNVYNSSVVSTTSAASGSLILLAYIVSAYMITAMQRMNHADGSVEIVDPRWKGQITYPALREWVEKITKIVPPNNHEAAAIALGLAKVGRL